MIITLNVDKFASNLIKFDLKCLQNKLVGNLKLICTVDKYKMFSKLFEFRFLINRSSPTQIYRVAYF